MSRTRHHGDKKKRELFGDNWQWHRSCPKWFRKVYTTRPKRANKRLALRKVMQNKDANFPLANKPKEWYW